MGGSGVLATRLGEHLADRGHTVHLITYDRPFLSSEEDRPGLHIEIVKRHNYPLFDTIGQPYAMSLASKVLEIAANPGLDVIHVHYAIPHILSAYAVSKLSGVPYVVTLHGSDAHSLGWTPSFREVMRMTLEEAQAVTTVSEFLRNIVYEKIGVKREINVIPNFIDIDAFKPRRDVRFCLDTGCIKKRETLNPGNVEKEERLLFHASNYRAGKRVPELIDAFKIVVDSYPNVQLLIAGDGPQRPEVESRLSALGLKDKVKLLGKRQDICDLLCCSDIFLLFSNVEGMPLTVLEAMSCGVPVVTTPVGGTPELVRSGQDGFVTKSLDKEEYAQAVIRLLEDEPLRMKLGAAGRRRVEESFSTNAIVPKYEKLLEQAIS